MEFHEAASIFPLDEEHIDKLAEDIENHGLLVPIETLDGKIIDGRRRWLACQKAGVEPDILEMQSDDPIGYVLSLNLHRRHLSPTQLSMCAARAGALQAKLAAEAKDRNGKMPVIPATSLARCSASRAGPPSTASRCSGKVSQNWLPPLTRTRLPYRRPPRPARAGAASNGKSRSPESLPESIQEVIADSPVADNLAELKRLAELPEEEQEVAPSPTVAVAGLLDGWPL